MKEKIYDLIIIGGGPAGVSSAIFAKKAGLDTLLIERDTIGNSLKLMGEITTYPGISSIKGEELTKVYQKQFQSLGCSHVKDEVYDTKLDESIKEVKCTTNTYYSRTVIIATGTNIKNLELKNEAHFVGRGLSYSATLDREKYENKIVAVFGGGTTALNSAIHLCEKTKKVYLISRRERFNLNKALYEKVKNIKNIQIINNSKIVELFGEQELKSIKVQNILTKTNKDIDISCLFVAIGKDEDTDFVTGIDKTSDGFIITDSKMRTSYKGVYAVGDIRNTELRDLVTAISDGAIASTCAYGYISYLRGKSYE